MLLALIRN